MPSRLAAALGDAAAGSRVYTRGGGREDLAGWLDAVWEACSPEGAVSPGLVALYAHVSRAGVHKRIKEGRLTAFMFHLESGPGGRPITLIPLAECRAWAVALRRRRAGEPPPPIPMSVPKPAPQVDDSWRQW